MIKYKNGWRLQQAYVITHICQWLDCGSLVWDKYDMNIDEITTMYIDNTGIYKLVFISTQFQSWVISMINRPTTKF